MESFFIICHIRSTFPKPSYEGNKTTKNGNKKDLRPKIHLAVFKMHTRGNFFEDFFNCWRWGDRIHRSNAQGRNLIALSNLRQHGHSCANLQKKMLNKKSDFDHWYVNYMFRCYANGHNERQRKTLSAPPPFPPLTFGTTPPKQFKIAEFIWNWVRTTPRPNSSKKYGRKLFQP